MSSVRRTLSEIRATSTKAVRGAGFTWGIAEEVGLGVRLLEAHGLPGAVALADRLSTAATEAAVDGLMEMAALADAMPATAQTFSDVAAPLLLVAPCLLDARDGGCWEIAWPDGSVLCGPGGARAVGCAAPPRARSLRIARLSDVTGRAPDWKSREIDAPAWSLLEAWAAKTYVPETSASRAAGAGPGAADD